MATALAMVVGCAGTGREPEVGAVDAHAEEGSTIDPKTCTGHVLDLPPAPVLLDRKGTLWIALYPNGTVLRDGKIVGSLAPSGCYHDAVGEIVARWNADGSLTESTAIPSETSAYRLRNGTLEFLIAETPYYVFTIEGNDIVAHRTAFMGDGDGTRTPSTEATIVGELDAATRELALRLVAHQSTPQQKAYFFRERYPELP